MRLALARILYRLSQSKHADRFLLTGALLFALSCDMPHRPTHDADLLGFGPSDLDSIAQTFRDIAGVDVDDGMVFDPASVTAEEIRKVETIVNAEILANAATSARVMKFDEAAKVGAMALFGEKYGDEVRVLSMGQNLAGGKGAYSVELCGGTHVRRVGDIGAQRQARHLVLRFQRARPFRQRLGIPHTLAEIGVDDRNADVIGRESALDPSAGGNPIPLDAAAYEHIFRAAISGRLPTAG